MLCDNTGGRAVAAACQFPVCWSFRCRPEGWEAGTNHRGQGARLCCKFSCFARQYHYLSIVQINPFRPSPSHSATDSLADLVYRFLTGPPLLGDPETFIAGAQARVRLPWEFQLDALVSCTYLTFRDVTNA